MIPFVVLGDQHPVNVRHRARDLFLEAVARARYVVKVSKASRLPDCRGYKPDWGPSPPFLVRPSIGPRGRGYLCSGCGHVTKGRHRYRNTRHVRKIAALPLQTAFYEKTQRGPCRTRCHRLEVIRSWQRALCRKCRTSWPASMTKLSYNLARSYDRTVTCPGCRIA